MAGHLYITVHGKTAETRGDSYGIRQAAGDFAAMLAEGITSQKTSESVFRNRRADLIRKISRRRNYGRSLRSWLW